MFHFQNISIIFFSQNHMDWNILRRQNFFQFRYFFFWDPDLRVTQISALLEKVGNFPLEKCFRKTKKLFIFYYHMNWNILQRGKFSTLLNFFSIWTYGVPNFCPNKASEKFSKFSIVENFPLPKTSHKNFLFLNHINWNILRRVFYQKIENFLTFPIIRNSRLFFALQLYQA